MPEIKTYHLNTPGWIYVLAIVILMYALPQLGLSPELSALLTAALGGAARALQLYFKIPDEQMPDLPSTPLIPFPEDDAPTPAAAPIYAAPAPASPQRHPLARFLLGG